VHVESAYLDESYPDLEFESLGKRNRCKFRREYGIGGKKKINRKKE